MADALDAARETDGAVDPTLGSVLVGLGYDRDLAEVRRASRPGARPVVVVRRPAGWRTLTLDGQRLSMPRRHAARPRRHRQGRCRRPLRPAGPDRLGTGVLVSLGGDIATAGPAPGGGWQVIVQDLPDDVPQQITLAPGAAVATSSTARRTWTQDGEPRHHLVDPRTGLPADRPVAQRHRGRADRVAGQHGHHRRHGQGRATHSPGCARTGLPARLVSHDGRASSPSGGWPREAAA